MFMRVCLYLFTVRAGHGSHAGMYPGKPRSEGFFEVTLKVMVERCRQDISICVQRVILGYTMLPIILGISPLPSQSKPRTQ